MILTRAVFSRLLAVVYFIAFLSLWTQLDGLIGSGGILPASQFMGAAAERIPGRVDLLPTLFWISSSDRFLHLVCGGGLLLSLVALVGLAEPLVFFLLWAFYLSLASVSGLFLGYQWDNLLLEVGFLAVFFAPFCWREKLSHVSPPSPVMVWLLRWLLFRLMFESGLVKILSGDSAWASFTALTYHYETQPLPTWIGWYAHQLPLWAHQASQGLMWAIELVAPFFIFLTRPFRIAAFWILVGFQILIGLTGNYTFFNLLACVLCVVLLDDEFIGNQSESPPRATRPRLIIMIVAVIVLFVSSAQMFSRFLGRRELPVWIQEVLAVAGPFRSINAYGLFAVMTTNRPEIIVEGSEDGITWIPYEFKWKPGDLKRAPGFVEPHQPRLDWQMWFAALGTCEKNPWFKNFLYRLLQGSPPVLKLLETNPFPDKPPAYVRAIFYDYRFTDWATKAADGTWWKREGKGLFCPSMALAP